MPVLAPSLAAGLTAILFSRAHAAPLAYIGGSLGTLIGADLFNLREIRDWALPSRLSAVRERSMGYF